MVYSYSTFVTCKIGVALEKEIKPLGATDQCIVTQLVYISRID
jgi:hypothetical protein